ncbi:MAG: endo alpha-1,4 polygalactosaminidase [Ligilactobacillus ruminis]|uniref:endo alpha-1,4 polygalactosaminidase n=1 Tax=Ligilactobacillus ruminis TaxID=1623 RepID=UPI003CFEA51E|nr:endo alpha-1,4 polygalactosaminidase [Ligilactobacillus ruminis]
MVVDAYLNIGSLENAQPYYKRYEDVMLVRYDGWPDEHWADVTKEKWQRLVVQNQARVYKKRGLACSLITLRYHTPEVDACITQTTGVQADRQRRRRLCF